MGLTKVVNGVRVECTPEEEVEIRADWAANKVIQDAKKAAKDAMDTQVAGEKADLPTWAQVVNAINNAFTDNAQANIIKKIARPVYTMLKKEVD